ncbi:MAG: hypothetical protein QXM91_06000, partial [Nitrososphaerota archaeon]
VLDDGSVAMHFTPTSDTSAIAQKLGNVGDLEGQLLVLSEAGGYLISVELFEGNSWVLKDVTPCIKYILSETKTII